MAYKKNRRRGGKRRKRGGTKIRGTYNIPRGGIMIT